MFVAVRSGGEEFQLVRRLSPIAATQGGSRLACRLHLRLDLPKEPNHE
jgi:hypothetical protein